MTAFVRREDALPGGHRFDGGHAKVLVHGRTDDPRQRAYRSRKVASGTSPTIVTFSGGFSDATYRSARSPFENAPTIVSLSLGRRRKISSWSSMRFSG